jgi:hypothetical protein
MCISSLIAYDLLSLLNLANRQACNSSNCTLLIISLAASRLISGANVTIGMNFLKIIIGIMHVSSQQMNKGANRMMKLGLGLQIRNDIESLIDR